MYISGSNITPFILLRFKFKPITTMAVKWVQAANNEWIGVDRGAASDVYQSELLLYGTETEINNFINELELNRLEGNVFNLSQFNAVDDQIFGADIDYSTNLDVTYVKWSKRKQKSFKVFEVSLIIQLAERPYPYDGTPALPELLPEIGYKGDATYTINKIDSYLNYFDYSDHLSDFGLFEGVFKLNQADMKSFRRYIMSTIRAGVMVITDLPGVSYPFGRRGSFQINVKVKSFKDSLININFWKVVVKFAESF